MGKTIIHPERKLITWAIPKFPEVIKNHFLGECKKTGTAPRIQMERLIKNWLAEKKYNNGR